MPVMPGFFAAPTAGGCNGGCGARGVSSLVSNSAAGATLANGAIAAT